jgi:hypothetical protein
MAAYPVIACASRRMGQRIIRAFSEAGVEPANYLRSALPILAGIGSNVSGGCRPYHLPEEQPSEMRSIDATHLGKVDAALSITSPARFPRCTRSCWDEMALISVSSNHKRTVAHPGRQRRLWCEARHQNLVL